MARVGEEAREVVDLRVPADGGTARDDARRDARVARGDAARRLERGVPGILRAEQDLEGGVVDAEVRLQVVLEARVRAALSGCSRRARRPISSAAAGAAAGVAPPS
jgi:hypothetical protein